MIHDKGPTRSLASLLALTAGATVANLYYSQPLLAVMGREFHRTANVMGLVPMLTQMGYAAGLALLVPLGDSHERRQLMVVMTLLVAAALLAVGYSPTFRWLLAASFLLGLLTIVPQLVVPYAAHLVPAQTRGRFVGQVMSGLLIGIILSRTLSGYAGAYAGWRSIYRAASVGMFVLAAILALVLPRQSPPAPVPYVQLLRSLGTLMRTETVLQRHALVGACGFGAFSIFWTSLVFHLGHLSPAHGSRTVGMLGLLGVTGALVAPLSGRFADRLDARIVNGFFLLLVVVAFVTLWAGGDSVRMIVVGTILLDAGVQGSHISNQTKIYGLHSSLHSRLNAVYMFTYFIGGALGSALGLSLWQVMGWGATCVLGAAFAAAGLAVLIFFRAGASPVEPVRT
ncbi:MAG: MFS transporter [Acidiferrobacteraceae bacterium]